MSEFRRKPVPGSTSKSIAYSGITPLEYSNYDDSSSQDQYPLRTYPQQGSEPKTSELTGTVPAKRQNVLRFWGWEIFSAFACVAILVAISAVLARFHHKKLPDWPLHINLNAAVAILADVLKAALLLIAGAIISQSKWLWFSNRARPLNHLQRFEEASRSILGSANLLFTAASHLPTLLATILTILAIAVGPFTQQAVQTTDCMQLDSSQQARIPIAQYLGSPKNVERMVSPDLYASIINGLVNPKGNDSRLAVTCPSGNCTFSADSDGVTHRSVALCSKCLDTTPLLHQNFTSTGDILYSLPDNAAVGTGTAANTLYIDQAMHVEKWAKSLLTDEIEQIFRQSLRNVTIITLTNSRNIIIQHNTSQPVLFPGAVAATCALHPCINSYHAEIQNGIVSERIVSSIAASGISYSESTGGAAQAGSPNFAKGNFTMLNQTCLVDGRVYTPSNLTAVPRKPGREFVEWSRDNKDETIPMDCLYLMSQDYGESLGVGIVMYTEGRCVGSSDGSELAAVECSQEITPADSTATAFSQTWWLMPLFQNGTTTFKSLASAFDDLVAIVSHNIRSDGSSISNLDEHQFVYGTVLRSTVCTKFEWRWLLFPFILTAAAVALLIWGIVVSLLDRTRPVWKNSLLPLLFYGLDGQPRQTESTTSIIDLNVKAKEKIVIFKYGDDAGFVEQPSNQSASHSRLYAS